MLGVLITLVFSVGAACFGHLLIRRLTRQLDLTCRIGVAGLVGLAAIGLLTLFIGLIPGGLRWGVYPIALIVLASAAMVFRRGSPIKAPARPEGLTLLLLAGVGLALVYSLVGVLAPADTVEWDSLAYHLAVPKLWLAAGHIYPISFIHHSNFPFSVDNLYIWGLLWGGEAGAKAFTLAFHIFGTLAIFGMTRTKFGTAAAWWAIFAWLTIPAVLWLSGTAYIDVQNGLFAGLGILFGASFLAGERREDMLMAAIALGFATGSKYTGLQTIFALGVVLLVGFGVSKRWGAGIKYGLSIAGVALAIASPWYVKNVAWVGNPVYPFFYEKLGGKNWSDYNARIYQHEQQTFGAGREFVPGQDYVSGPLQPQRIGHAILGLAYQPGRYINPDPINGNGFPIGALGATALAAMMAWLFSGRATRWEGGVLAAVLVSLAMWFVLSEQSRYIIALCVPLCVLLGGGIVRLRAGPVLAGVTVLQALYSFYLLKVFRIDQQLQAVTGQVDRGQYLKATVGFYEPAQSLNEIVGSGKVALYDEVFGYLLDVPYIWANPGHTTELGYEKMSTGDDLARSLRAHGITHIYLNLSIYPRGDESVQKWAAAAGLRGAPVPYSEAEREEKMADLGWRWKILLAEAVASGKLRLVNAFGSRLIFAFE